jgi:hypothetical protein
MRDNLRLPLISCSLFMLSLACKKNIKSSSCEDAFPPVAGFVIKEIVGDTSFIADTVFRQNWIVFKTTRPYDSVSWKVGNNPGTFDTPKFEFKFTNILGTIEVNLNAKAVPNQTCFPNDDGVYSGKKSLTIVEKFDKDSLTISPMVGRYKGAFIESSTDTFSVTINYFDSAKYNPSFTGTKNFYWISNIPKGYQDLTSLQSQYYPELRNGMGTIMGYKCLQFGDLGDGKKGEGHAELKHDTLVIYYLNALTGRYTFIGKRQ